MGLKVYTGSAWSGQATALKLYNGSTWVNSTKGYVYDGTQWRQFYPEFPANTTAPTVSFSYPAPNNSAYFGGVGQTVTSSAGTWTNSGTITYQWQRAFWNATSSWSNISGATASSYFLDTSMVAYAVRCAVTNTNNRGSTTVYTSNDNSVLGPKFLTGLTASKISSTQFTVSWNASYGASQYYIQYSYSGYVPTTEITTTATSATINVPSTPGLGFLVSPLGPSSNGFPSAAYNYGYPGYGANAGA